MCNLLNLNLAWEKMNGLIPAIIQDSNSGQVLMLGYMNEESLNVTQETGFVTFYSRSKQRLWQKGETSGNKMKVISITADCDSDSLLIIAKPAGPACHLGDVSCYKTQTQPKMVFLNELINLITQRSKSSLENSYTCELIEAGVQRCAQKVGEEAVETILAATSPNSEEFLNECADLLFHFLVLLQVCCRNFYEVVDVLQNRHKRGSN